MLHIGNVPIPTCGGVTRRSFLQLGTAGLVGLNLPDWLRMKAGSPGHLDTWDLKPNAPADVKGPFKPINTKVPGIDICEHLPLMAKLADKYSLIRSLSHPSAGVHGSGHQWMMTGHGFNNDGRPDSDPGDAKLARERTLALFEANGAL